LNRKSRLSKTTLSSRPLRNGGGTALFTRLASAGSDLKGEPIVDNERPSPFTIPEPTLKFVKDENYEPTPKQSMSVGGLIHNLIVFADFYEQASAAIANADEFSKLHAIGYRDANVNSIREEFQTTEAIDRVRTYILKQFGAELTIGTARKLLGELISKFGLTIEGAESLTLEVAMDGLESGRISAAIAPAADFVVVLTAGDLWKALKSGKHPSFQSTGISVSRGTNTPAVTCPDPKQEQARLTLDHALALVDHEGGDQGSAMDKLLARVQLKLKVDKAAVINMPLADFVSALTGFAELFTSDGGQVPGPASPQVPSNTGETGAKERTKRRREKRKRGTAKSPEQEACAAALTLHHKYENGSCGFIGKISLRKLAADADVSTSTAKKFFDDQFGGHTKYVTDCQTPGMLAFRLKVLNGDLTPSGFGNLSRPNDIPSKQDNDE
jgi:hypothetical protein